MTINPGVTVTVTADAAANSITFANTGTATGILTVNAGVVLTVTTGITLQNNAATNTSAALGGAGTINAASVTVGGTITNLSGDALTTLTSTISTLSLSGNLTLTGVDDVNDDNDPTFNLQSGSVSVGGSVVLTEPFGSVVNLTLASGAQTGTLTLSGATPFTTTGFPTFTANGTSATVVYSGAAQTVNPVTYTNLTLSGSGAKTLTSVTTINGNLALSGTATATTAANMTIGGNLSVGTGTTFTVAGFNFTVNGTTSVTGTLNHNNTAGTKQYTGLVTINAGGVWNTSVNEDINFRGGLTNNGSTFTSGAGVFLTTNNQAIGGTSAISIPNLTVTGVTLTNNGTLTVGTALAGSGGLTNGATGTLNIGGTSAITTLTATAGGNTVNYNGAAQTVKVTTYSNLIFSGSGAKSVASNMTVGNLSIAPSGTATGS